MHLEIIGFKRRVGASPFLRCLSASRVAASAPAVVGVTGGGISPGKLRKEASVLNCI